MKSIFKNFQSLIIIGLIIVIFLLRECRGNRSPIPTEPVRVVKVETKYDTIVETVPTYIPKYKTRVNWKTKTVHDTISQNRIVSRNIKYRLVYPTTIIQTEREVNKRELYVGFGLGGDRQQISYAGSELILRTKKDKLYGVGIGVNNSFQPILTFKMNWKVKMPKLKKPKIQVPIESLL